MIDTLIAFHAAHAFWFWLAVGAVFLAVEVGTATGYLLWPAAASAVVAILAVAGVRLSLPAELALFAGLTLVSTIAARRFFPRHPSHDHPDLNDMTSRLVGRHGQATSLFEAGRGRVVVEGKEWLALAEGEAPVMDQGVKVVGVDGSTLKVRAE